MNDPEELLTGFSVSYTSLVMFPQFFKEVLVPTGLTLGITLLLGHQLRVKEEGERNGVNYKLF